jgi:hypothetical protein
MFFLAAVKTGRREEPPGIGSEGGGPLRSQQGFRQSVRM